MCRVFRHPTYNLTLVHSLDTRYLQELTVKIESLTNLGEGIARDGESSWVVMVAHVIPGEVVKCQVFRNHASYSEATLVSADAVTTLCKEGTHKYVTCNRVVAAAAVYVLWVGGVATAPTWCLFVCRGPRRHYQCTIIT